VNAFDLASRYIGVKEITLKGQDHPLVQWWLSLCGFPSDVVDETPWCSAFVNGIAWELRLPRSKSAAARSWLGVGRPVNLTDARPENDVIVIRRGTGEIQGHVGFYAGWSPQGLLILGGNQGDQVCIKSFPLDSLLGIRRLT